MRLNHQQGIGFADILFATLLFSITQWGILRYHQQLLQQITLYQSQQQLWRTGHALLEYYGMQRTIAGFSLLTEQQYHLKVLQVERCQRVQLDLLSANIPATPVLTLERWFCDVTAGRS